MTDETDMKTSGSMVLIYLKSRFMSVFRVSTIKT